MKFKVGDKVVCPKKPGKRALEHLDAVHWIEAGEYERGHTMDDWVGKVLTIRAVETGDFGGYRYLCACGHLRTEWWFTERWLKAAK